MSYDLIRTNKKKKPNVINYKADQLITKLILTNKFRG